jgi:hypothetical protein
VRLTGRFLYILSKFATDSDEHNIFHRESTQSLNMPLQLQQLAEQPSLTDSTRPHSISSWRTPSDMFDNSSSPSKLRCADLIGGHLSAGLRPISPFSVSDSSDGEQLDVIPFGMAGLRHRCQYLLTQETVSTKEFASLLESADLIALGYDDLSSQNDISCIREQLHTRSVESRTLVRDFRLNTQLRITMEIEPATSFFIVETAA